MIYSCFDQSTGLYKYWEDSLTIPVNGDLPVPSYLSSRATKLGVPSLEAGRPLPSAARSIGEGHRARGMIVRCDSPLSGFIGTTMERDFVLRDRALFAAAVVGTAGFLWWSDQEAFGAIVGVFGVAMFLY